MIGSAIERKLSKYGCEVLTANRETLNLLSQCAVEEWVQINKPDTVIVAAAKVGGIFANSEYPAEFLYQNIMISTNIIDSSFRNNVKKLLFLGSSCIYPKFSNQPITEPSLLNGPLEPTNQFYAIAKIAAIKLCLAYRKQYGCDFISAMPTNLYGPGDNYHPKNSHVVPALIKKIYDAKSKGLNSINVWGSGLVKREFMHADDCADALIHILQNYSEDEHINVGVGYDVTIKDLASRIMKIADYPGSVVYDTSMPDGTPKKLLSNKKLSNLGWNASISLDNGLRDAYNWYVSNISNLRSS
jgi:GDP-L-fucose synthase